MSKEQIRKELEGFSVELEHTTNLIKIAEQMARNISASSITDNEESFQEYAEQFSSFLNGLVIIVTQREKAFDALITKICSGGGNPDLWENL